MFVLYIGERVLEMVAMKRDTANRVMPYDVS